MATPVRTPQSPSDPRGSPAGEAVGKHVLLHRLFGDAEGSPRLGRFVLIERVGEGAMGTVWSARDEDLDRRVAVKILHRGHDVDNGRLLAEARVMASVNHPNVAQVYEVGAAQEQVFIAMEFVAGQTLRAWAAEEQRPWTEVVGMYAQAARGLAAAHAVGVVHRDFKPDNALIGSDGRVRVVDFGLAYSGEATEEIDPGAEPSSRGVAGTPAYMAPEQLAGGDADARSDQFSLCVALFEALAGERPFDDTARDEPRLDALPDKTPAWLRDALKRGLEQDPSQRFDSMTALLGALDPQTDRRPAVALAVTGVAVAVFGAAYLGRSSATPLCPDADDRLHDVWDADRRDAVRSALSEAGPSYAATTVPHVEAGLDAYAAAWLEGHRDACEATHVRHEQSEALLDARMRCLTDQRRTLEALVGVLAGADAKVAAKAVEAVETLPSPSVCADAEYVEASHPPADDEAGVDAELDRLARARADLSAGRFDAALELAEAVHVRAQALEYPPLLATASHLLGAARMQRGGEIEAAEHDLRQAYRLARKAGQDPVAARAAADLAYLLARHTTRLDDAKTWADLCVLEAELVGDERAEANGNNARGIAASRQQAFAEADAAFERAETLLEPGAPSPSLLQVRANRARNLFLEGKLEAALELAQSTLQEAEALLGRRHPGLLSHMDVVGQLLEILEQPQSARPLLERAVEISTRAHGAEHPNTARLLSSLGRTLHVLGEYEAARPVLETAVAASEAAAAGGAQPVLFGLASLGEVCIALGDIEEGLAHLRRNVEASDRPNGPLDRNSAIARGRLARALLDAGRPAEALEVVEVAMEAFEKSLGPDHIDVAEGLWVRARALSDLDRLDAAASDLERAIDIVDAAFSPESPKRASGRVRLGDVRLRQGRAAEARTLAERGLALIEDSWAPHDVAEVRFLLARAIAASGGDTQRALELATRAAEDLSEGPPQTRPRAEEIATWRP